MMGNDLRSRILIVDDEPVVLELIRTVLEDAGWATVACSTAEQATEALDGPPFDVVVADLRVPGLDAISLHRRLALANDPLAYSMVVVTGDVADSKIHRFAR